MLSTTRRALITAGVAALCAAAIAAPASASAAPASAAPATVGGAAARTAAHKPTPPLSFAVIGDVPYGAAEIAAFPSYIQDINAHKELSFVAHAGDIKNGSSLCTTEYFNSIRANFDTFTLPLVYTPGDNEWTDCHRANNGAYNPLERLKTVRDIFFPKPGTTLGAPMKVKSQAKRGYPENVLWEKSDITFTAVNIPGSNNSMLPWAGLGYTAPTAEQITEVQNRTAADIKQLKDAFRKARVKHDRAVVIVTQADMFDPTVASPSPADYSAFTPLVKTLVDESNAFGKPVYLINGDSHVFHEDYPLAAGSKWLSFYGQATPAKNLTRVTVDGSNNAVDWLKVTENPASATVPLSFERVPFTHPAA